jgi:hypothetical protein
MLACAADFHFSYFPKKTYSEGKNSMTHSGFCYRCFSASTLRNGANGMKLTIANNVQRGYKEVDAVQIVGE